MNRAWLVLATLSLVSAPLSARELLIAFGIDKPPFVFGQERRGLEIDIVRAALAGKGYTVRVAHVANLRLQIAIREMGVDGAASVRRRNDGNFYSDDFITYQNFAITHKADRIELHHVEDLKGHTIVAWQNAWHDLGPAFEQAFNPGVKLPYRKKYFELASQRSQNAMFWLGRAEVILVDKTIFLWYRKALAHDMNTTAAVTFHDLFPERTAFQVAFKDRQVRDDFNEGLRHLRESGRYQQLYERYIQ